MQLLPEYARLAPSKPACSSVEYYLDAYWFQPKKKKEKRMLQIPAAVIFPAL